jgi:site-specific DNA-methyltransferase (adenine-specific)
MKTNIIYNKDCIIGMRDLPDNSVDLVITDPPYMVSQAGAKINRKKSKNPNSRRDKNIILDFGDWDNFEDEIDFFNFTERWFSECVRVLKPKGWIYIFFDKQKMGYFDLFLSKKFGIKPMNIFAWLKSNPVPSCRKTNWISASEFIWVGSKGKCKIKNFLQQKEMFNYMITPNKSSYGKTKHPTEKPELVIEKFVKTNSVEGDIVLDCFMGSGTTAVVCKRLGRNYIGYESHPEYYQIAINRLSETPYHETLIATQSTLTSQRDLICVKEEFQK